MRIGRSGKLRLLKHADAGGPGLPSDDGLSPNDKYLYVLDPFVMGGTSHIDVYRVGRGGSMTLSTRCGTRG